MVRSINKNKVFMEIHNTLEEINIDKSVKNWNVTNIKLKAIAKKAADVGLSEDVDILNRIIASLEKISAEADSYYSSLVTFYGGPLKY